MFDKGNGANYPVHENPPPNMPSVQGSYPQAPPYAPPGYGEPGPAYPPQGGMNPQPYPPPYYPPHATTMPTNPDGTPHQMPREPTAPAAHLPNTMPHGAPQYNITSGIQGPAPPIHTTTVVTAVPQNTVYLSVAYYEVPVATVCKFCNHQIVTRTAYAVGGLAWLICAILILFGCWAGCCLIPFCIDGCKDVNHFCPNCNQLIQRYKRL